MEENITEAELQNISHQVIQESDKIKNIIMNGLKMKALRFLSDFIE